MSGAVAQRVTYLQKWSCEGVWDLSFLDSGDTALRGILHSAYPPPLPTTYTTPTSTTSRDRGDQQRHPPVTMLYLAGNRIGPAGAAIIEEFIRGSDSAKQQLATLSLGCNRFAQQLPAGLLAASNSIGDAGAARIAAVVGLGTRLRDISLSGNAIGPNGADSLAAALRGSTSVTAIDLSANSIADSGAASIAEAIRTNTSLRSISLARNGIGSAGASAVALAVAGNSFLRTLDFGWNSAGQVGAAEFAKALASRQCLLRDLVLRNNAVGDSGVTAILAALRSNQNLVRLALEGNSIGDNGATEVAAYFRTSPQQLREIQLGWNLITDGGASAIRQALGRTPFPQKLGLDNNPIADKTIVGAIAVITDKNLKLTTANTSATLQVQQPAFHPAPVPIPMASAVGIVSPNPSSAGRRSLASLSETSFPSPPTSVSSSPLGTPTSTGGMLSDSGVDPALYKRRSGGNSSTSVTSSPSHQFNHVSAAPKTSSSGALTPMRAMPPPALGQQPITRLQSQPLITTPTMPHLTPPPPPPPSPLVEPSGEDATMASSSSRHRGGSGSSDKDRDGKREHKHSHRKTKRPDSPSTATNSPLAIAVSAPPPQQQSLGDGEVIDSDDTESATVLVRPEDSPEPQILLGRAGSLASASSLVAQYIGNGPESPPPPPPPPGPDTVSNMTSDDIWGRAAWGGSPSTPASSSSHSVSRKSSSDS